MLSDYCVCVQRGYVHYVLQGGGVWLPSCDIFMDDSGDVTVGACVMELSWGFIVGFVTGLPIACDCISYSNRLYL